MDYKPLDIKDSDESTQGGPPGWVTWGIIVASAVVIAITVIVFGIFL